MPENIPNPPAGESAGDPAKPQNDAFTQQFQHNPVAARVPEKVARGVLATGVLVLDSPTEFVLDFMQGLSRPHHIAARVVLTPPVMEQFLGATQENLNRYVQQFGVPPQPPKGPPNRPTIQDIYENFKLSDDMLSGSYANSVMVGHSPSEFFFDFITGFYPHAAVSARVFMSAPQVPRLIDAVNLALQQYQRRFHPKPPEAGK